jgi:hypothetical protein
VFAGYLTVTPLPLAVTFTSQTSSAAAHMVLTQPVWPGSIGASTGTTSPKSAVAAAAGAAAGRMAAAPAAQARAMEALRRIGGVLPELTGVQGLIGGAAGRLS